MRDRDIDEFLNRGAGQPSEVDPELLDRISASVRSGLRPVRPLPSPAILVAGLVSICAAIAVAGGLALGPHGIQRMSALQIAIVFPVLAAFIFLSAALAVAEVIPGNRRPVSPWLLSVAGCIALALVFALLFSDPGTSHFVSKGLICLRAGLIFALPTGVAGGWLLRRGFAVNPPAAWFAAGTLAGLAGVTMLELHCANFEAPHLIMWHIAVIPVSALIGFLAARTRR
ncbi:MAG TPA: NrsF family protein [Candidatus Solibacter sp.]